MASYRYRDDRGYWELRWRTLGGLSRRRRCPTEAAARQLQTLIEAAHLRSEDYEPGRPAARPAELDLRTVMAAYITEIARTRRAATLDDYARRLEVWRRWLEEVYAPAVGLPGGRIPLRLLTRQLLREHHAWLQKTSRWTGRTRGVRTANKHIKVIQRFWQWAWDEDDGEEWEGLIPKPRSIKLPEPGAHPPVAPTWDEMDACITVCSGWQHQAAVLMRFTGLRAGQVMRLLWTDLRLERGLLTIRGELGKSTHERRGRIIPISTHLVTILQGWERDGVYIVAKPARCQDRRYRSRDFTRAWRRAGVREAVWAPPAEGTNGKPQHAFRRGFTSQLKRLGADSEAVEHLLGRKLQGQRSAYLDPDALPLLAAVALIPALSVAHPKVRRRRDTAESPVRPRRVPAPISKSKTHRQSEIMKNTVGAVGLMTRST
jgi:integrase